MNNSILPFYHNSAFFNNFTVHNNPLTALDPVGENTLDLKSFIERNRAYYQEYKYNLMLAVSRFKPINFEENKLNPRLFLMYLIENGSILGFKPNTNGKPVIFTPYLVERYNYQVEPSEVRAIPYYENGVTVDDIGENRQINRENFEIVYLNNCQCGLAEDLSNEATIVSILNQVLINNATIYGLQAILQGTQADECDYKKIIKAILNQNGIISVDVEKNPVISELMNASDLKREWVIDKVYDAKEKARRELHEKIGITHAPYEKKERLTNVEIQTQNEATDLMNITTLNTINEGLDRVNKHFELEKPLSVEFVNIGISTDPTDDTVKNEINEINNIEESEE